jgi:hypothetical protein
MLAQYILSCVQLAKREAREETCSCTFVEAVEKAYCANFFVFNDNSKEAIVDCAAAQGLYPSHRLI